MAKKMKLDSLLTANKNNKGIENVLEYSNQDKEEKKPSSQDLLAKRTLSPETDFRRSSFHDESRQLNEKKIKFSNILLNPKNQKQGREVGNVNITIHV